MASLCNLVQTSSDKDTFFFEMVYLVESGVEVNLSVDNFPTSTYYDTALDMLIAKYYTGATRLKDSIYYLLRKKARISADGYKLAVGAGDKEMLREMHKSFTEEFIQLVLDGCYTNYRLVDRLTFLVESGADLNAKTMIPTDRKMIHFENQASMCELALNYYFSLPVQRQEVEEMIVFMLTKGAPVDNYCLLYASCKGAPKLLEELLKYSDSKKPVYYLGKRSKEVIEGFGRIAYSVGERHLYETDENNPFDE